MKDHRLVHAAIFLIIVAVSLVYALFFDTKAEAVRHDIMTIVNNRWGDSTGAMNDAVASWAIATGTQDMSWSTTTTMIVTGDDSFLQEVLGTSTGSILSGTTIYYGALDILKTLGIRYEYILKDKQYDIFYAYIWKDVSYSISELARAIGWKTVEIYARNDIINNLYFGDRITFVELPQSLPTVTNLFVRIWADLRMIQDITWQYKQHKKHIRDVFTK